MNATHDTEPEPMPIICISGVIWGIKKVLDSKQTHGYNVHIDGASK